MRKASYVISALGYAANDGSDKLYYPAAFENVIGGVYAVFIHFNDFAPHIMLKCE